MKSFLVVGITRDRLRRRRFEHQLHATGASASASYVVPDPETEPTEDVIREYLTASDARGMVTTHLVSSENKTFHHPPTSTPIVPSYYRRDVSNVTAERPALDDCDPRKGRSQSMQPAEEPEPKRACKSTI